MRLEMTRTFPVPLRTGWDYIEDFHTWNEWMMLEVVDPESSVWHEPGDAIRVKSGRSKGTLILEEIVDLERTSTIYKWRGWPDIHVEHHYEAAGPGAFTARIVAYLDEDAGLRGKAMWRMTQLPFMMPRFTRMMLDLIDAAFRGMSVEEKKKAEKPAAKAGKKVA